MLRIVAGAWRGRRIRTPDDDRVRPTADRVREAWLSIVGADIPAARVLDLFAGSGALGLEALSRGATSVDFVDNFAASIATIRDNAATLGAGSRAVLHRVDAIRFVDGLAAGSYDLAFADPPYGKSLATQIAERWLARPFATVIGIEHHRDEQLPGGGDSRKYGATVITFLRTDVRDPDRAIMSADSNSDTES